MRANDPENATDRRLRRGRSIACVALAALLSLWTLGTLHAAEHDVRHDTTSCGTCIAVAADDLVSGTTWALPPRSDTGFDLVPTHQDPAATRRVLRQSARAPPTPAT